MKYLTCFLSEALQSPHSFRSGILKENEKFHIITSQEEIRAEFSAQVTVVIPQGVGVAVLKGAVLYGLDPAIVHVRRAKITYGIGVIKPFKQGIHPIGTVS